LITASEDSDIIIYRCKDWTALHKLSILNKSKIVSMSLHPSGKILLALHANGVLRLWNMLEARCKFKRKIDVIEGVNNDESEHSDADLEITVQKKNNLS
jgi:WD40 repeat protein